MSFRILGTGSAAPKFTLTNDQMAEIVETSDEWIRQRTGIGSRRICKDENLLDLSVRAAEEALASAGVRPEELDLIICTTLRGELITPNHACLVQERIGASCPAFDINVACTGLIYALDIADCYFARGKTKKILIVAAEEMSSIVDWTDRSTCVLFGDGTGAVVLGEGDGLRAVTVHAEGNREVLYIPRGEGKLFDGTVVGEPCCVKMDGGEVYKFAVNAMTTGVQKVCEEAGISPSELDFVVPHQANLRIIKAAMSRLHLPMEKAFVNIESYGNTSSASLYIALDELVRSGKLERGMNVALTAFGGGLTSGAALFKW